ncbi:PIN domain-containing protein [Candidatus Woesearchaeota archaeon]|nr:PIN domain-containing protein [Candidatus Woesearchaeota archaeon]
MELVIDANIVVSALIAAFGKTYDLIFNDRIRLFSTEFLFDEFEEHKEEILAKSGLSEEDLDLFLSLISAEIEFMPYSDFKEFIPQAKEIVSDPDDTEYLALALKLNCAVWSNDKRRQKQDRVKVYSTENLLTTFRC